MANNITIKLFNLFSMLHILHKQVILTQYIKLIKIIYSTKSIQHNVVLMFRNIVTNRPTRTDLEGLELGQGDGVVFAIHLHTLGTSGVVEVDFALCVHGFDPFGGILVGTFKNFGLIFTR